MNKYLKTENASITIEYNKNSFYTFLLNNFSIIEDIEIQRIYIVCDVKDVINIYNELIKYKFKNTTVFIKVNNYSNKYNNELDKVNDIFYTIVCCNIDTFKNIKYNSDSYYELNFKFNETEQIIKIINQYNNILLNIDYDLNYIKDVNNSLNIISQKSNCEYINFSNILIDKNLIYACPYNIYLNNKYSHRNYGNNIPRNIYIDYNGNVYCINIKNKSILIGNIDKMDINKILTECKAKKEYKNFIKFNEILFISYLEQCPYQTIDYIAYLNEVIKHNE